MYLRIRFKISDDSVPALYTAPFKQVGGWQEKELPLITLDPAKRILLKEFQIREHYGTLVVSKIMTGSNMNFMLNISIGKHHEMAFIAHVSDGIEKAGEKVVEWYDTETDTINKFVIYYTTEIIPYEALKNKVPVFTKPSNSSRPLKW